MCTVEDEPDPEGMLNGSDLEDMSGVRIHKLSTATPNYPTHNTSVQSSALFGPPFTCS